MPFTDDPRVRRIATVFACFFILGLPGRAPAGLADIELETVVDGLEDPVAITHLGDDRLFVSLLRGRVVVVEDGELLPEPFLDLSDRVLSLGHGLLSIAFHPDYAVNGFVYTHRTEKGTGASLVTRLRAGADGRVDPATEVVLLRVDKERRRHYGGQLQFGPDGYLYVSVGDDSAGPPVIEADPECAALSLERLEGKILRLDVDRNVDVPPYYGIPADNPFPDAGRPEVWSYGLRNPWRISFDRETGDLWIGDVGEDDREEVNRQPAASPGGENYGWKVMEGTACLGDTSGCAEPVPACNSPALTPPVLEYSHLRGAVRRCAVTGGYVYRGRLVPDLHGHYLYGDFCLGTIWAAHQDDGAWLTRELGFTVPTIVSFGEDVDGEIYLASPDAGAVFRLVDPTVPAAGLVELASTRRVVGEGDGRVVIEVLRVGDGSGEVSVRARALAGTATAGVDYAASPVTLSWADGETGSRELELTLLDDDIDEPDELLTVALDSPTGGVEIGARGVAEVVIEDDDAPSCVADATHLCLNDGRFRVSVSWRTADGQTGFGRAVPGGADAGSFWFFSANNPEIFVKVLDACRLSFNSYWVFAAGLTDVATSLRVVDTGTGVERRYDRPLGVSYEAVRDTAAFDTCP